MGTFGRAVVAAALVAALLPATAQAMVNGTLATAPGSTVSVDADTAPCSGTLIAPSVVLTAAHCLKAETTSVRIRTGTVDRSVGGDGQTFDAVRWTVHPEASPPLHDLAYVDLGENSTAVPATTPAQGYLPPAGTALLVRGFGLIAEGGEHQVLMREGQVQTVACPSGIVAPAPTVCTKTSAPYPTAPCRGDSGGPLMTPPGVLIGVMSQASSGCQEYSTYTPLAGNLGFFDDALRQPRLTGRLMQSTVAINGGGVRILRADGSVAATAANDGRGFQAIVAGGTYDVEASAPGYATRRYEDVVIDGPVTLSPALTLASANAGKAKVTSASRRRDGRLAVRLTVTPPTGGGTARISITGVLTATSSKGRNYGLGTVKVTVKKKKTLTVLLKPSRSVRAKAKVGRKVRIGVLTPTAVLANVVVKIRKG